MFFLIGNKKLFDASIKELLTTICFAIKINALFVNVYLFYARCLLRFYYVLMHVIRYQLICNL